MIEPEEMQDAADALVVASKELEQAADWFKISGNDGAAERMNKASELALDAACQTGFYAV